MAFHEAGHAVAAWFLQYAEPLLKVCTPALPVDRAPPAQQELCTAQHGKVTAAC